MFAFARRKYAEMEYGYPSVVTPGVFKARSIPCSFTSIPMISGRSTPGGSPARNDFITSSLSAIWRTCFGETKLTASICFTPAAASLRRYWIFVSVGMISVRPCQASRGHSMIFTISDKMNSFIVESQQSIVGYKFATPQIRTENSNMERHSERSEESLFSADSAHRGIPRCARNDGAHFWLLATFAIHQS